MARQTHHSKSLDGAQIHLVGVVQYLAGVAERTGDPEHAELERLARALCLRTGVVYRTALTTFNHLRESDPATFDAALSGHIRWPDEPAKDFEAVCTCWNECIFHDHQPEWAAPEHCNCDQVCPRHQIPRTPGDREPKTPLGKDMGEEADRE